MRIKTFSTYQVFVITVLSLLQFTLVLDFIVISPLGAQLIKEMNLSTANFGLVVSVYAFSAGISGILTAGFADKFDRRKLLLFFYAGFIAGTLLCGIANSYRFLMVARIITGFFGGVIGSISFAIVTDLFRMELRGRVMGFIQMAFSVSQVLGIPIGLYLANKLSWHSPFIMIFAISIAVWMIILIYLKPINAHLGIQTDRNAFVHLFRTVSRFNYFGAFTVNMLLITGGYMLMPLGSTFAVNNLGLTLDQLPGLYMITGLFSMMAGPLIGKFSDMVGKYRIFFAGSLAMVILLPIYCNLGITSFWIVTLINIILTIGVLSRIISVSALMTAIPEASDRGAFMSVNSSVQQVSGGIAAIIAGMIAKQSDTGRLIHYNTLGYVVVVTIILTVVAMYYINKFLRMANRIPDHAARTSGEDYNLALQNKETA